MKRHLPALAAFAALASLTLPLLSAAADQHPITMVLHLSDVPSGFVLDEARVVSNADLLKNASNTKDYRKLGRLTGYDASFSALAVSGLTEVDAFASVYRTTAGAHLSLRLALSQAKKENSSSTVARLPAGAMPGNEALAYRTSAQSANMKVDYYIVAWRHGPVFAEVIGGGRAGTVSWVDVLPLAKKQDARIARVLRSA